MMMMMMMTMMVMLMLMLGWKRPAHASGGSSGKSVDEIVKDQCQDLLIKMPQVAAVAVTLTHDCVQRQ
eukprot:4683957-Karenia_brevis.AAC.1